jgi:hypothetical protein
MTRRRVREECKVGGHGEIANKGINKGEGRWEEGRHEDEDLDRGNRNLCEL